MTLIGSANGSVRVSITGLGTHVPERVVTNDDFARLVDTSDEWIVSRTGIRERHFARDDEALSDIAMPAAEQALAAAGVGARDIDLLVVATVTADMQFPSTAAILADRLGAGDAAAYDLAAGCTGFMYGLVQAFGMVECGLSRRVLVVGGDVLSKLMNMADRSTCVLFGDGAGAAVVERVPEGGFLGFELGADGGGGMELHMPAGGSRMPTTAATVASGAHYVHMNGREVFKFATRVLVASAEAVLAQCDLSIADVDVYVPHQANVRIIDHAVARLGIPKEKVIVNVARYGNTSSASIPLALAEAISGDRLHDGDTVLMTGMGAGLTWGSAVMRWTGSAA
jgi:3-oxoacyl-[acyl-carrier-protein] synthase III